MSPFLESLFEAIAIDIEYLNSTYLNAHEKEYLNNNLKSIEDLGYYTNEHGLNLEVLLHFLSSHKDDIVLLYEGKRRGELLLNLYTSSIISGDYDCFRFDLSKFEQTFEPSGQTLTLYRIGRKAEVKESLGNSWSTDVEGLKCYASSSDIDINSRPIFVIEINDSEVLSEGNPHESELILKKIFKYNKIELLGDKECHKIFVQ